MRRLLWSVVAVGLLGGADGPKSAGEKDAQALRGTWTMLALTIDGEGATGERVSASKLVVEGDRFTPMVDGQTIPCTFRLDPSATPKAIDITYTSGDLKGQTVKGIYRLDGDTFVMCRTLRPKDDRPGQFSSESGSKLVFVVWQRAKP